MTLYIFVKIIHIIAMIFFIGVVSFRTFVLPVLQKHYDTQTYKEIDKLTGMQARSIIKVNNLFLIMSGLYLLSFHLHEPNPLLYTKVSIGLTLALTFYVVPILMRRMRHVSWFSRFFHYLFFTLMMVVVVLSQAMFA